ncbi:MAG: transglutaminase domain-containing protein [Betaproteobacteria bacterium]|nr:transglutaminase domain-containing protein [Betaproteobacteria bacterium]
MSGKAGHPEAPVLLLTAGVAFWGWQSGYYLAALAIALLVEAPRWTRLRLELGEADFNRIADFTTWLFVGIAGYLVATRGVSRGVITAFEWLPGLVVPIVAVQRFSRAERINLTALLRLLRRLKARGVPVRDPQVDLSWLYLALSLIAAGASNQRGAGYFAGVLAITGWALWSIRPAHASRGAWLALFVLGSGAGYAGHVGLAHMQGALESWISDWLVGHGDPDPYSRSTNIGHVGELKLIGAIVARVHARPGDPAPPQLLHRASYNVWFSNTWIARAAALAPVAAEADGKTWVLSGEPVLARTEITARFEPGRSLIALPEDTVRLTDLAAVSVGRSALGTVQTELEGGWVRYVAERGSASAVYAAPNSEDGLIPPAERELLKELAQQLGLNGLSAPEALERVRRHFSGFSYSLYRAEPAARGGALAEFLTRTHSGHCEYFAAATTLLLRAAGIPARYAVGYAVMEYSTLEEAWLVRQRHAHAWSRAWVDGRWVDVDTTPPDWFGVETKQAPGWEKLADWLRWAGFSWSQRNASQDSGNQWLWLAAVLAVVLAWRLARYRTTRDEARTGQRARTDWPGRDSEFYALERGLAARGWPRPAEESAGNWAERVGPALPAAVREILPAAARLHERYRFDPAGLPGDQRAKLRELCTKLLGELKLA